MLSESDNQPCHPVKNMIVIFMSNFYHKFSIYLITYTYRSTLPVTLIIPDWFIEQSDYWKIIWVQ